MQLNITTDYAIRFLTYIAKQDRFCSSSELSRFANVGKEYTHKILRNLRNDGLVVSTAGKTGGYNLSRPAEEISILDIMNSTEETTVVNKCLEEEHFCSRDGIFTCEMHRVYERFQKELENYFGNITIKDIAEKSEIVEK